jgi:hypothetical protein
MTKDIKQGNLFSEVNQVSNKKEVTSVNEEKGAVKSKSAEKSDEVSIKDEVLKPQGLNKTDSEIEKIVIFYADKTMEVYFNRENS